MKLAEKAVKNYFNFKGRSGIREFILAHIMIVLINICLLAVLLSFAYIGNIIVSATWGFAASSDFLDIAQELISIAMILSIGLGIAAIDSRRLHDLNLTSWWLVAAVMFLIVLNLYDYYTLSTYVHLFFIIALLFPADKRANRYGATRCAVLTNADQYCKTDDSSM